MRTAGFAVLIALFFIALHSPLSALSFVREPSLVNSGGNWTIDFEVSETTDVEVAVVDTSDASIVRRLAAGRLGSNPPPPLIAGTLHQVLPWDGKDDLGDPVANTGALRARVRAGMAANTVANFVGGNPYDYTYTFGATLDGAGSVYIYGRIGAVHREQLSAVRKFDANSGRYLKTIFPYPAGMDSALVAGWGIGMREDRTYYPKYASLVAMNMSRTIVTESGTRVCPFLVDGGLLFNKPMTIFTQSAWMGYLVGDNSSFQRFPGHVRFVMSPVETPNAGPLFIAKGTDPNMVYISGAYKNTSADGFALSRAGFWLDGSLYKLDMATGTATLWKTVIRADSVPDYGTVRNTSAWPAQFAALHGLAFDDSGRVFLCDRMRQRIGVYDTATWALLSSIPVADPHMVEINRKTDEIYVLSNSFQESWSMTGNVTLRKFSGFRTPVQTASVTLSGLARGSESRMAVWQGGDKPVVWVAGMDVWGVRDDGSALTLITRFSDSCKGLRFEDRVCYMSSPSQGVVAYQRLAVDRRTETVYSANGWSLFTQIRDWQNPRPERCTTSLGAPLNAGDAAVSPDGYLYVRQGECWYGPISRYTTDRRPAPAPFPSGSNAADTFYNGKYGSGFGDKGIAVSRTGRIALMEGAPGHACEQCWARAVETDGSQTVLVYPVMGWWQFGAVGGASNAGGIKFDYDGNVYIGVNLKGPGAAPDWRSSDGVGCIIKFPPSGGFIYKLPAEPKVNEGTPSDSIYNALKIYSQPYSAFSPGLTNPGCGCQNPRFDLDPYGRLFIPDMVKSRVSVTDNNGNDIALIGRYGNIDDPAALIPLASPLGVAASDDFIYVADINNARLARVRMDYTINNLPWMGKSAGEKRAAVAGKTGLIASPNPFNPAVAIALTDDLSQGARLRILDVSGRVVADLSGRVSNGRATWNAAGFASGLYVVAAEKGTLSVRKKIIYSK